MTDLRKRKKEKTRDAILAAAKQLFVARGFAATTMEEIAQAAEVGVGTLYNYFGAKGALLLAWGQDATEQALAQGQAFMQALPSAPTEAIAGLLERYFGAMAQFDKPLLRELMAEAFGPTRDVGQGLMQQDFRLVEQLSGLITTLKDHGAIRKSVDVNDAALLLYGVTAIPLMMYINSDDQISIEMCLQMTRRQVALVFEGLRETAQGGA